MRRSSKSDNRGLRKEILVHTDENRNENTRLEPDVQLKYQNNYTNMDLLPKLGGG